MDLKFVLLRRMHLSESQIAAILFFQTQALRTKQEALDNISYLLKMTNVAISTYENARKTLLSKSHVVLHFHPDRLDGNGLSVAQSLLRSKHYKNQFETNISNGSVSAHAGGERDKWEHALYGGAFHKQFNPIERPKYGALDLLRHPDGPAPRFGSCYFVLKPTVLSRCTFTYLDSHTLPQERGTIEAFDSILSRLFSDVFEQDWALGESLQIPMLIERFSTLDINYEDPSSRPPIRNLNHYVEAQVHGEVRIDEDVDFLVIDPSFQNSETGDVLGQLCDAYKIAMKHHQGFSLRISETPSDFRGAAMPSLAKRVGKNELVTAKLLGDSARDLVLNPKTWQDRGEPAAVLQEIKLLWHTLVKYGKPYESNI